MHQKFWETEKYREKKKTWRKNVNLTKMEIGCDIRKYYKNEKNL